jgi:Skp family chaperone for outer membrane proteins
MPNLRTLVTLLGAALVLGGCDKLPLPASMPAAQVAARPGPKVAVLDLAAVAKALGRDQVFKEQTEAAGRQLQQQLSEFATDLQQQLREEQSKLGEEPSEEDQADLRRKLLAAQRQVQQSQRLARQKATEFQVQIVNAFRTEVRPVAAEVARANGANSVLLTNAVLWFEPAVDITGQVIDAMRARLGEAAPAPAAGEGASQDKQ